jgi:CelD/BcsL family acetyltransferase involved in cellulose biosynthesis
MRVDLVGGDGWDAALSDWEALYSADPSATPFTSPGWARAWMRVWASGVKPFVLRVTEGGRAVGLAPLVLERRAGMRVLTMLGKEPGDYWDVLAEPGDREMVVAAVARELARRRRSWDVCIVNCMPAGSSTPQALRTAGLRIHERTPLPCPSLQLPATFEEYLAALPGRRRSNLRRHLRRLDEHEVQLREMTDPAELPAVIDLWQELRRRQWAHQGREITAAHLSDRFRSFILGAVTDLLASGQVLVWEFRHEDRVVAVYVNFVDERAFYWYLGGIEPDALSLGIGKIAIGEGIRSSIAAGRSVYDFTRGSEDYKYWYGAVDVHVPTLLVGHSGGLSRLAMAAATRFAERRDRDVAERA